MIYILFCISLAVAVPGYDTYPRSDHRAEMQYQNAFDYPRSDNRAEMQYQNAFEQDTYPWSDNRAEMQYQNTFDADLTVTCNGLQGIYRVLSVHSNYHEDRSWSWECRNVVSSGSATECSQTADYVNDFDGLMNFMCPPNKYIAGVYSYHSNYHEDRRWKFTCCAIANRVTASCRTTGYVNDWDAPMNFQANTGEVITGVFSYHSNYHE